MRSDRRGARTGGVLRRTGSQAQFSEPLKLQAQGTGRLADVCTCATNNLGADLLVESFA